MPRPLRTARGQILDWAEQGALPPASIEHALRAADVTPDAGDWRRFVDSLFLWTGTLLVAAGVIFFFAYNWQDMGRFLKFGLVEILLLASVATALIAGPDRTVGKAALFMASVMTGGLLALIGQTYQTGADPYQLFAWWAALILPWVVASRLPALWLLLITLLNMALALYFERFADAGTFVSSGPPILWSLFGLNTAALALWELGAETRFEWLRPRWAPRLLALAAGVFATYLGLWAVFESRTIGPFAFIAYVLFLGAAYFYYRHRRRDLFVLAGGVLSVIVLVTAFLTNTIVRTAEAGGFLFIGVVVLGLSAAGAWWLKQIAAEGEDA